MFQKKKMKINENILIFLLLSLFTHNMFPKNIGLMKDDTIYKEHHTERLKLMEKLNKILTEDNTFHKKHDIERIDATKNLGKLPTKNLMVIFFCFYHVYFKNMIYKEQCDIWR